MLLSYSAYIVSLLLATLPKALSSPLVSTSLLTLPSANLSSPLGDLSSNLTAAQIINWHVAGSVTSLEILTGAALQRIIMRNTLRACRSSIARAMYWNDPLGAIQPDPYVFPLPSSKDPRDMKFTGAGIKVESTWAQELGGLTWRQLDAAVNGLQDAMLARGVYKEAQFKVFDGLTEMAEQAEGWLYTDRGKGVEVA